MLDQGQSTGGGDAVPSGILAWKIPWTEEPGGLQSSSGSPGGGETERTQELRSFPVHGRLLLAWEVL